MQIAEFAGGPAHGATIYEGAARLYELATQVAGDTAAVGLERLTAFCKRSD